MSTAGRATSVLRLTPLPRVGSSAWYLVERNFLVYRRLWLVFVSGFAEPALYLFSVGVGVAVLVSGFRLSDGTFVEYTDFVAPAMLATSAMNGAVIDSTYNIFFKIKFSKQYEAVLATPMRPRDVAAGEITWALLRGSVYSAMFLLVMFVMGLLHSWWALAAWPVSLLLGYAFAGVGMALTTWMRTWQDFEFIQLAILPMFLFSATFFPIERYPGAIQWVVRATPLYQGVDLLRGLCLGSLSWVLLVHVAYLAAMGSVGLAVAGRRLGVLMLH